MNLKELCVKIELQDEMARAVEDFSAEFDFSTVDEQIARLVDPDCSADARTALETAVGDDPKGVKILSCYLRAALITREKYDELGVDEKIYIDTMKCFPRFIGETLERNDLLAFQTAYWSYRHLNTTLVRIGTLEYERKVREGVKVLSIHIPSNADLSQETLDRSVADARKFMREKFPEYGEAPMICESWLLSERLRDFLGENSKILKFQAMFDIQRQNAPSKNALTYIFHRANCDDYASLPENTSLQRKVKAFLLAGGGIGSGYGVVKNDGR